MQFFLECPGYVKYQPQANISEQYRTLVTEMWSKKRCGKSWKIILKDVYCSFTMHYPAADEGTLFQSYSHTQGWIYWGVRTPLAPARGGGGWVLFFMIKQTIIRDKMRYSNLSNNMMISEL
jgi:hypothetical protein